MNDITFKGIKNVGGCCFSKQIPNTTKFITKNNLIMQLTDDYNGRDLTAFNNVMRERNNSNWFWRFPDDNRILHIMTEQERDASKEIENPLPKLFLNYNAVPVNKKTLSIFSFIAKLTRRISNMDDNEFVRSADFVYGPIGRICLVPEYDMLMLAQHFKYKFKTFMDEIIFNNKSSREFANAINKDIDTQMRDYLR